MGKWLKKLQNTSINLMGNLMEQFMVNNQIDQKLQGLAHASWFRFSKFTIIVMLKMCTTLKSCILPAPNITYHIPYLIKM